MDFVDSGCAMRKTVTRQNSKLRGESSKSDYVIWEIEVPKVTGRWLLAPPAALWFLQPGAGSVPSQGVEQRMNGDLSVSLPLRRTGVMSQYTAVNNRRVRATPGAAVLVGLIVPHLPAQSVSLML